MIHHPPEYVLHNSQTSHVLIQDNNIRKGQTTRLSLKPFLVHT